ncbi:hypothetical protein AMQ83_16140 [Paenibacillus riograndensis]|nr:hypothetical protein AMQ83_16140 [Paenibacillus riograndensis]
MRAAPGHRRRREPRHGAAGRALRTGCAARALAARQRAGRSRALLRERLGVRGAPGDGAAVNLANKRIGVRNIAYRG